MSEKKVLFERRDGGVVNLILNNPNKRNAIDLEMRNQLIEMLDRCVHDPLCKVIVLSGYGGHFCSGADIKGWGGGFTPAEARARTRGVQIPIEKILNMEKPVIAMVRGFSVGAGMNLCLACDIIIASNNAMFGQPFVKLGMIPDAGGMCFLPLVVGIYKAKELMFSSEFIGANEAAQMGFVNMLFPIEDLEEKTLSYAQKIANGPPLALGMIKRILNITFYKNLQEIMEYEAQGQPLCIQTKDHEEGKAAFLEKRSPKFTGS